MVIKINKKLVRCIKPYPHPIRCSKEFKKIINEIKARYILAGKNPPSASKITQIIANKIVKEDLLKNDFIFF